MHSDTSASSTTTGSWHEVQSLFAFARERLSDAVRSGDALSATWARRSLSTLDRMHAHLLEVPPSSAEVRRYLVRLAATHSSHRDYQAHWSLIVP